VLFKRFWSRTNYCRLLATQRSITPIFAVDWRKKGKVIGPADLIIAATARAAGAVLVTHNTKEFSRVPGLQIEDWTK